jgi:U3 small nucleolar RNA-associated protein 4
MAAFEGNGMSVVVSGGPDASPMVVPLRNFGVENQRTLPRLPQQPSVQSVPSKRLVMSWWDREVLIWSIIGSSDAENDRGRKLLAKVLIKGEANIVSAAIS